MVGSSAGALYSMFFNGDDLAEAPLHDSKDEPWVKC
jgi:hypothetical protein